MSMNTNRAPQPYGPAYQEMCAQAAIAAGCKRGAMSVFYCLMHQRGLWDWATGQTTREIAHSDLAKALGGADYKTIQRGITALRQAGVLTYADERGRGVKWSNGEGKANRYKLLLPPLSGVVGGEDTPTQKTGRPLPKKRADPYPKNGQHYHNSISPKGENAPASRGQPSNPALQGRRIDPETGIAATWVEFQEVEGREYLQALRLWQGARTAATAAE